ncbi:GNAT family N-acetyltransferase [Arcanobacterium haemolyticum]|nr:GNAT family N-acetyltransferase [Arcanobacterium haemolyticum]
MSVELVPVTLNDLEALRDISIATFTETFGEDNTPEDLAKYLDKSYAPDVLRAQILNPESMFFLAEREGEVIGYLKLNFGKAQTEDMGASSLEVERIYILSTGKRSGTGSLMIRRALSEAEQRGLSRVWLGVWEHNLAARAFYEHFGFVVTGSHVFQLGDDAQTDLIMERPLVLHPAE